MTDARHEPGHHPGEALLSAYAAGSMAEPYALAIAVHVSLCDDCRAEVEASEALGGAVLDLAPPAALAPDALEHVLARLEVPTDPAPRARASNGVLPAPLRAYVGGDVDAIRWRGGAGGVKQAILLRTREGTARLLSIAPGRPIPEHGHRGLELTLVLSGAFDDGPRRFARGDIEVADADDRHVPVAAEGEPCLCLAVTDAPLRFHGLLPRLAQPFLKNLTRSPDASEFTDRASGPISGRSWPRTLTRTTA